MVIADNIDYVPKKVLTQIGPTCSSFAFFLVLSEFIQQKYNKDVEFDIYDYYDDMLAYKAIILWLK